MKRYRHMADEDFNAWGRFPRDIELLQVRVTKGRKSSASGTVSRRRLRTDLKRSG
jgi:hypothetical protein